LKNATLGEKTTLISDVGVANVGSPLIYHLANFLLGKNYLTFFQKSSIFVKQSMKRLIQGLKLQSDTNSFHQNLHIIKKARK